MDAVVVVTQEKAVDVAALLQLKHGRNRSIRMKLLAMEVTVVRKGYALVAMDTGLYY